GRGHRACTGGSRGHRRRACLRRTGLGTSPRGNAEAGRRHDMTKIAFLGLGMMGTPMATRLLGAGHDLTVWDRTDEKTKVLVDRGAVAADSPAETAVGVDVAITMLANPERSSSGWCSK